MARLRLNMRWLPLGLCKLPQLYICLWPVDRQVHLFFERVGYFGKHLLRKPYNMLFLSLRKPARLGGLCHKYFFYFFFFSSHSSYSTSYTSYTSENLWSVLFYFVWACCNPWYVRSGGFVRFFEVSVFLILSRWLFWAHLFWCLAVCRCWVRGYRLSILDVTYWADFFWFCYYHWFVCI